MAAAFIVALFIFLFPKFSKVMFGTVTFILIIVFTASYFGNNAFERLVIIESFCGVAILFGIYRIIQIVRDPHLSKEEKWKMILGQD